MVMLKFVEEDNGQTYLWQKAYSSIPGLGEQPSSSYIYMKLPDNPVSPEAQSAWDARSGKLYLALNMKYSNIQYPLALPVAAVATDPANMPGYMVLTASWTPTAPRAWPRSPGSTAGTGRISP